MPAQKAKRLLKEIDVEFLSLVKKGANKKTIIVKSDDLSDTPQIEKYVEIKKTDASKKMVYAIVYSPNEVDTHGDTATAETIEKASQNFMKKGITTHIDKQHNYKPEEGFVVENWIVKENDPVFPDEKAGSWAVGIKVEKEETWKEIENGDLTGISLAGDAWVKEIKSDDSEGGKSILEKIEEGFASIKKLFHVEKDFNDEIKNKQFRDYVNALSDANYKVLWDDTIDDKKTAIIANVNQFLKEFKNVENPPAKTKTEVTTKSDNSEDEMKPEEIQKAITDAIQPLSDKISALEKSQTEKVEALEKSNKELTDRLAVVEKAAPGSSQVKTEPVKKEDQNTVKLFT